MSTGNAKFWDRVAKLVPSTGLDDSKMRTLDAASRYVFNDSSILDVGCGLGDLTLALAWRAGSVLAIDPSGGMIKVANAAAEKRSVTNVTFSHADLNEFASSNSKFDVITAFNVLPYVPDVEFFSLQINRLLAQGGMFVSATTCFKHCRIIFGSGAWALSKMHIIPSIKFFKEGLLKESICRAGFQIVESRQLYPGSEYFVAARKIF